MINENLHSEIEAAGFRIKTFKIRHLEEISTEFEKLAAQGLLDEDFYKSNLTDFNYDCKSVLDNAKSVMVIASPQYKSLAEFKCEDRTFSIIIPPTYIYPGINSRIVTILDKVLAKNGYSFVKPVLPVKLLVVRSGLGQYGRNNICYIPGLGSFVRLSAFITDYEFEEDSWGEMQVMESCSSCSACIGSCPTGAIDKGRFLIHAENCLTNFNEYETPIPEWVNPDWHNSIVGCMKCQAACPHNKKLLDLVNERIFFDENETRMILDGHPFADLPVETRNKISQSGMEEYYNVLPRNIRLVIDKM
jgi:epoxyqueuosine reductase